MTTELRTAPASALTCLPCSCSCSSLFLWSVFTGSLKLLNIKGLVIFIVKTGIIFFIFAGPLLPLPPYPSHSPDVNMSKSRQMWGLHVQLSTYDSDLWIQTASEANIWTMTTRMFLLFYVYVYLPFYVFVKIRIFLLIESNCDESKLCPRTVCLAAQVL